MDLKDLYQELIVDHNRSPRNFGRLEPCSHQAEGFNPLCGDQLQLFLQVDDGIITDLRFDGSGCAISVASASLMTQRLKGQPVQQAHELFAAFQAMVTADMDSVVDNNELGKLAAFGGVRAFPSRIKCAILCWHALRAALAGEKEAVVTE